MLFASKIRWCESWSYIDNFNDNKKFYSRIFFTCFSKINNLGPVLHKLCIWIKCKLNGMRQRRELNVCLLLKRSFYSGFASLLNFSHFL